MTQARRTCSRLAAVACAALLLAPASCGRSPTAPADRPAVHRTVTIEVRDSLGGPAAGAEVWLTAQFDSAGLVTLIVARTDAGGALERVLADGPWIAWTGGGGTAAGSGFMVAGAARALSDTQVVRLALRASARATGLAKFANRADHGGIFVTCPAAGAFAVTDSTGAYALEDLPPGRWPVTCSALGWKLGLTEVVVPAPGAAVTVPTVTLYSDP